MLRLILVGLVVCSFLPITAFSDQMERAQGEKVSLINVIADPMEYEGKNVRLMGYLYTSMHGEYALFFSAEHAEFRDFGNAIQLRDRWSTEAPFSLQYCPNGYITVDGTVRVNNGNAILTDLYHAAFFYDDESEDAGLIGCMEDVGEFAEDFLEEAGGQNRR